MGGVMEGAGRDGGRDREGAMEGGRGRCVCDVATHPYTQSHLRAPCACARAHTHTRARSLRPVETERNPLSYDRLDIKGHLEKLQACVCVCVFVCVYVCVCLIDIKGHLEKLQARARARVCVCLSV